MGKLILEVPQDYFNPVYRPFVDAKERYQLYYGGAGSGKSAFVAQRVALDAVIGRNTLVVRQVARRIHDSCYNEIVKAIDRMHARHLYVLRADDITCTYSGAQILFSGLDDVEKVKSVTPQTGVLTDIWMEEATEMSWQSFRQLDKRLRGLSPHTKRITITFNPSQRLHWLYREYFEKREIPKPLFRGDDLLMLHTTHKDNLFLTKEDGRALERETDAYQFAVYTLGEWGHAENTVLTNWQVEDLAGLNFPHLSWRIGLDFGFSRDPAAAVRLAWDAGSKTIYIMEELYRRRLTNDVLAGLLRPMVKGSAVMCDSAEPKSIEELRRYGIRAQPARKGPDSIAHGVRWLRQNSIVIDPRCENFIKEIEAWGFKKDPAGEVTREPGDRNNHLMDALRYALSEDMAPRRAIAIKRIY